jgi:general secretion pathway protein J
MTRPPPPRGFTLIEVLIALTLTGIVSLLALEGVRLTAMGVGRLTDRADRLEARRSLEDLLRRELGATFAAPRRRDQASFVGGPQSLQFVALAEDGGAGLYRDALVVETQDGVRRLALTRRRLDAMGAAEARHVVLVPRLGAWRIGYFGAPAPGADAAWQDRWEGLRDPPALVRLEFDTGDGLVRPPLIVRLWTVPR